MNIKIPEPYQDLLVPAQSTETRTDDELRASLLSYNPVTSSEKNIWAFWDTGFVGMPGWCQRNVLSWFRINPGWTVRVLDGIPESPNYVGKYIPSGLPDAFYRNTMDGTHNGQHSADFLRGACLYTYGGVWMDSSIFVTRSLDDAFWNQLEDPACAYRVAAMVQGRSLMNCMVASRKHDPFIKRWQDIFMAIWEGRTHSHGIAKHPLLAPVFQSWMGAVQAAGVGELLEKVPLDQLCDYGAQMICWHRVTMLEQEEDGFCGADYWTKNVMWIDLYAEGMRPFMTEQGHVDIGGQNEKIFNLFTVSRSASIETDDYKEAEKLIWTQLTQAIIVKVGTIKGFGDWVALSTLWNRPENLGKDALPGTFGELMRLVPQHYRQTRKSIRTISPVRSSPTLKKKALEL